MKIRTADASDAALIASHRRAMFAEMRSADEPTLSVLERNCIPWNEQMLRSGKYLGWIATDAAKPIASAGLLILDMPPHPLDPEGALRAHMLNVYVEPSYRNRGLARQLVQLCMAEAHRRNIRVITLNASDAGRSLYEKLGFRTGNEMTYITPATQ